MKINAWLAASLLACSVTLSAGSYQSSPAVDKFIDEMVSEHKFDKAELKTLFAKAEKKQSIIDAISRPAEKRLTWGEYRDIFIKPKNIQQGVQFWKDNADVLKKASEQYGVPEEVIVAIIGVETRYGQNKGSYRVLDALSTLAFDYPPRSSFFRGELKSFLLLAREQKQEPTSLIGSYAGAMGYGQFIPSSYRAYAVDFSGDGFTDIWNNSTDAIGSVANYFARHHWRTGEPVTLRAKVSGNVDDSLVNQSLKPYTTVGELKAKGFAPAVTVPEKSVATAMKLEARNGTEYWVGLHNFYVITRYNHSRLYAMAVWQLSQEIAAAHKAS